MSIDEMSLEEVQVIQRSLRSYSSEHDTFMEKWELDIIDKLEEQCKDAIEEME